ncbi:MAG: hypothetical protein M1162_04890 [Candidatus Thermoplasmatota archaeon]|jgi:uncharacterized membrane protein|nr:hypothetical protein [Candidatus Thermoplasmatota archaeon]
MIDLAILLAALGITLLEMSEASAVAMALYADSRSGVAYYSVAIGTLVVLLPTFLVGNLIQIFPIFYVRLFSATLLLYFGLRLIRSSRRSMKFQRLGPPGGSHVGDAEKGLFMTGFGVGVVESFEAAIVLIALLPAGYTSAITGFLAGIVAVIIFAYALRSQIRKVKQANVKVAVSALLLSFALFWYAESFIQISDLLLIPFFVIFFLVVYSIATYRIPKKQAA